jgi:flagellar hook-associated protein 3 FlgL
MTELQAALQKSQQQIASGKRILTAADDPVAAARALEVTQGQQINTQFGVNRKQVQSSLGQEENSLQGVTSLLQDIKTTIVNAGDGALDPSQLKFMAADLQGQFNEMMGMANSRDAIGNYVFGGYQTNTQPFSPTATGVVFNGDSGQRLMQVATTRQMSMADSGQAIFSDIKNGNGNFVDSAAAGNTGTGIVSPGTITGTMSSDTFKVIFAGGSLGVPLTYSVFNTTTDPTMSGTPESTGTYVDSQAISFDGGARSLEIKGVPVAGDSFDSAPSTNESVFTTMQNLINLLNTATSTPQGRTSLSNGLTTANQNIDNVLNNVLTVRASVGSRLKELDNLDSDGDNRNLLFAQTLSSLTDLDYVSAISNMSQQTTTLDAAQKSFVKVTGLSLFNYI